MNLYRVEYSQEALVDIKSIYTYISQILHAPLTARRQVNRIRKEIRDLEAFPTRYVLVEWEPWASMKMHRLPIDNYVVFYLVDEQAMAVKIVRIVYGGRNLEDLA
ncbi:type II toxin-antitoxin system RelE/ParE family toxin [Phascolarctobacterium succinatutens]|uniref:Toxin-antitoxin system toxin component RelE family n=1 Tax=Phascolarctobacterium succinatutens CAG:287 TaxID=1263101 RepID=R6WQI0_9FIRM|nr:type II toxin-antitoxin system RelE/ParE family toxin [Phascolarctobacterium succinatutens]CDD11620.1 toxin-antitoxin system toxin component RelE family [Phascolarctobacterium succinatutens CAG:287]